MRQLAWTALVALILIGGCSRSEAPQSTAAAPPAATAPAAGAAGTATAPVARKADADTTVRTAEAGESVDEAASDFSPIAAAVAATTPAPATPANFPWKEGTHYSPLPSAQPTSAPAGTVEVTEIFWYGCGHCYTLEPRMAAWEQKGRPAFVKLVRMPVVWNEATREDARLFYTIESLGKLATLHAAAFKEIHVNRNPFTVISGNRVDTTATERKVREFLLANGVTADEFGRTYRSFAVESKIRSAENLSRRYMADHTPMVVINGKYTADVGTAGGLDQLMRLITDLATRERASR